ncbi:hypothetical protein BO85DRAFT_184927 [Aspergillus piperis CBS 112811]|uniref:Uncharacterized protein n=1 Tax=Aspergillus piperis CBS 112811 TaxID=1448313 RepID=A0A8G1R808_9EURO|nr:hypothetical protein BO85DRAFT_184927 [Aspergillus piperis CBS 112811]RAH61023.1 hypothetical protein BO85DRAFT_184927 [Aspergillus piperis CBS 112811]
MNGVSPGSATPPFGEGGPRDWSLHWAGQSSSWSIAFVFWREFAVWGTVHVSTIVWWLICVGKSLIMAPDWLFDWPVSCWCVHCDGRVGSLIYILQFKAVTLLARITGVV